MSPIPLVGESFRTDFSSRQDLKLLSLFHTGLPMVRISSPGVQLLFTLSSLSRTSHNISIAMMTTLQIWRRKKAKSRRRMTKMPSIWPIVTNTDIASKKLTSSEISFYPGENVTCCEVASNQHISLFNEGTTARVAKCPGERRLALHHLPTSLIPTLGATAALLVRSCSNRPRCKYSLVEISCLNN